MRRLWLYTGYVAFACSLLWGSGSLHAEEIRDYYSETGLHPFKGLAADLNETIDPFSGTMQLRHTDITVPGNGGLDINVTRFYTNHQGFANRQPSYQSSYGIGWTMHFGRIVVPQAHATKICAQALFSVSTNDNPSIEQPDGSRELLVLTTDGSNDLITKSNWRASCPEVAGQDGMLVIAPDGTQYKMDTRSVIGLGDGNIETSWYTSEIIDVHGNAIRISYQNNSLGYLYFDEVTGGRINADEEFVGDGRLVKYRYATDEANGCSTLQNITSNQETWSYRYGPALPDLDSDFSLCRYNLTEVTLPSGQRWQYDYIPSKQSVGSFSLSKVIYPYGGMVEYTYQHVKFDATRPFETTAVHTKNISGPNITSGTWTYLFFPASVEVPNETGQSFFADTTQINQPNGFVVHQHQGASAIGLNNVWTAGLLMKTQVVSPEGVVLEEIFPLWDKRLISNENYFHGVPGELDTDTYAPIQLGVQTLRNGNVHSTFMSNHDQYGNPGTVEETTVIGGQPSKITDITYFNDPVLWIIGKPEDETLRGIGTIDRSYNALGQVISESTYGVVSTYTYTPEGDVNTITDARENTVIKGDYFRGIARFENHPESVTLMRTITDKGSLESQTNGRGFTQNYTYDELNRLTAIDFPINADVNVVWTVTGKVLTRANFIETVTFDGFGQEVQIDRVDINTNETITHTSVYDALGQKVFASYPNSTVGVKYSYDVLGRITRMEHPDGALRSYSFGNGGIVVTETDERNNQTETTYRAYGHPENGKVPIIISAPESVCTFLQFNLLNQITEAFQGSFNVDDGQCSGFARSYSYDENFFLHTEEHLETGLTTYGRDEVGNTISRQVGESGVTKFTHDKLNRLVLTDYPGNTPDTSLVYDKNSNVLRVDNADSLREYVYDDNDNLLAEVVGIGADQYIVGYTYDANDNLKTLTYPTGRVVDYAADAFGRPTQIMPYVTAINYHPSGQTRQTVYANGQTTDVSLTDRLWIDRISVFGVTETTDLNYDYDAIGNIESIADVVDPNNNRLLSYDKLNRLVTASGSWGMSSFSYDGRGNIRTTNRAGAAKNYGYSGQRLVQINHGFGLINLFNYDEYGNAVGDTRVIASANSTQVVSNKQYIYDDSSNLRSAIKTVGNSTLVHDYGYDGNGMRVSKSAPSEDIKFVYGQNGNLLGEYGPADGTVFGKEYIYLGSQLIASPQKNQLPVASAGPSQAIAGGALVRLNGSSSIDPDGKITAYNWQQRSGTVVTLSAPMNVETTFTAPNAPVNVTLIFELIVTDNDGEISAVDTIDIVVQAEQANTAPTISVVAPQAGAIFSEADSIAFRAVGSDVEDGDIGVERNFTIIRFPKLSITRPGAFTSILPNCHPNNILYSQIKILSSTSCDHKNYQAIFGCQKDGVLVVFMMILVARVIVFAVA